MDIPIRTFQFSFGSKTRTITGGPYRSIPPHFFGVKMAVEINMPCEVNIPTHDFSIPEYSALDDGIRRTLFPIARKQDIYCGCMGGIGRTGLFFGALMTTLGDPAPVKYVRDNYKGHAIETSEQQKMVNDFKPSLRTKLTLEVAKVIALFY